jgi:dihydrofolate reductase
MGATTYDWLLRNHIWPAAEDPRPWPYRQPVWVFTHRSWPVPEGADIRFVRGDVRPVHEQMARAAAEKDAWLVGGGDLVGQFWDHGLLDELIVTIASVTLGAGAPLLPRRISHPPLRLVSARQRGDAFAELTYEVPKR